MINLCPSVPGAHPLQTGPAQVRKDKAIAQALLHSSIHHQSIRALVISGWLQLGLLSPVRSWEGALPTPQAA